jgi:hypothetical protein
MEEVLATLTAPQMTDVAPNRWGEPMIRPKAMTINDDLKAGRGQAEIISGIKLSIIGWDRKYNDYENGVARLLYRRTIRLGTPFSSF